MLMLDEPAMGLSPLLVQEIFDIIQNSHKEGMTILLVEQNAQMAPVSYTHLQLYTCAIFGILRMYPLPLGSCGGRKAHFLYDFTLNTRRGELDHESIYG